MPRVAIIGSRKWPSPALIRSLVATLPADTVVVSGGAIGVDSWAVEAAKGRGLGWKEHRPEYGKHPPKLAPLKRNETIINDSDAVYAFWDGQSRGTIHACKYARSIGRGVTVLKPDGTEWGEEEWNV